MIEHVTCLHAVASDIRYALGHLLSGQESNAHGMSNVYYVYIIWIVIRIHVYLCMLVEQRIPTPLSWYIINVLRLTAKQCTSKCLHDIHTANIE